MVRGAETRRGMQHRVANLPAVEPPVALSFSTRVVRVGRRDARVERLRQDSLHQRRLPATEGAASRRAPRRAKVDVNGEVQGPEFVLEHGAGALFVVVVVWIGVGPAGAAVAVRRQDPPSPLALARALHVPQQPPLVSQHGVASPLHAAAAGVRTSDLPVSAFATFAAAAPVLSRQPRPLARVAELPLKLGHLHEPLLLQAHPPAPLPRVFPASVSHVQPPSVRGERRERVAVRGLEIEPRLPRVTARRTAGLSRERRLDRERSRQRRRRSGQPEQRRQRQQLPGVDVHG